MLRIAICCLGGFSSSALARHLEKAVQDNHLQDEVSFVFIPIHFLLQRMDEVDIAMVCPHSENRVRQDAASYTIPVTIIPPRLYGLMPAEAFIEDAIDLYAQWQKEHVNPCFFPEEQKPLRVTRTTSHRRWLQGKKGSFGK